jgi:hypothetical protein
VEGAADGCLPLKGTGDLFGVVVVELSLWNTFGAVLEAGTRPDNRVAVFSATGFVRRGISACLREKQQQGRSRVPTPERRRRERRGTRLF